MKYFTIETVIKTENDWTISKIKSELDFNINRGDGAYIEVGRKCKIKCFKQTKNIDD